MVVCEWVFFVVCVWGGGEREKKETKIGKGRENIVKKRQKKRGRNDEG